MYKTAVINVIQYFYLQTHIYQPGWTLVGAGLKTADELEKPQSQCIPKNTTWIQSNVSQIEPTKNLVQLDDGNKVSRISICSRKNSFFLQITYDYLIVAAGIETKLDKIKGAIDALDNDPEHVVSVYSRKYVRNAYNTFNKFRGGQAIFTFPATPIKCPGAPQKVMYLAEDLFRRVKDKVIQSTYQNFLNLE